MEHGVDGARLPIPDTVQAVLAARMDRLPREEKRVLQTAAVIGNEVPLPVLQALVDLPEDELHRGLSNLQTAEFFYATRLFPEREYTFKHVLTQQVAYQSLLMSRRQQLHHQIALVLEEQFPEMRDTRPELLAYHYTEAGLHAQAMVYWQQAARRALERFAHADAIVHAQQGLAALVSLPDAEGHQRHEIILQTMLGSALAFTRGYGTPEVARAYARARELCQQIDDMPQLFPVLRGLWLFYLSRGELSKASELGDHLRRLAEHRNEPALLLETHRALAATKFFLGEQTAVVPHLERCLMYYDTPQPGTQRLQYGQHTGVMFFLYKAWNLWLQGYPDQALHTLHQMMTQSQQQADFYRHSHALILAAVLHQWCGEIQVAHERVEASLAVADEQMYPFQLSIGMTFQGWFLAQQGRLEEGIERMQRGIMAYRSMGLELFSTYMLAQLADVYRQAGHVAEGLHCLTEALAISFALFAPHRGLTT